MCGRLRRGSRLGDKPDQSQRGGRQVSLEQYLCDDLVVVLRVRVLCKVGEEIVDLFHSGDPLGARHI